MPPIRGARKSTNVVFASNYADGRVHKRTRGGLTEPPGWWWDIARTMRGRCQDDTGTLPERCGDAARTMPGHCQDGGGTLPERCGDAARTIPGHCQDGGGTLPERCVNLDPDCHLEGAAARRSKFGCFSIRNHIRNAPFWRGPPDPARQVRITGSGAGARSPP